METANNQSKWTPLMVAGLVEMIALIACNILHGVWTYSVIAEEVKTGWGHPTNMDLFVFYPWILEFVSIPLVVAGIALFISAGVLKQPSKKIIIPTAIIYGLYLAQVIVTNVLLCY